MTLYFRLFKTVLELGETTSHGGLEFFLSIFSEAKSALVLMFTLLHVYQYFILKGHSVFQYLILKRYSGFANCGPGPLIMQAAPQQLISQASLFHKPRFPSLEKQPAIESKH